MGVVMFFVGGFRWTPMSRKGAGRRADRYREGQRIFVPVRIVITAASSAGRVGTKRAFEVRVMRGQPQETLPGWWASRRLGAFDEFLRTLSRERTDGDGTVACVGSSLSGERVVISAQRDDWWLLLDATRRSG